VFRILWHGDLGQAELGAGNYATIEEATAEAERIQRAFIQRPAPGFDIVWAESARPVPNWFRQAELGF
jgi:hypothetical protein